ncbi:MAG: 50S ribosomal protein L23 [Candidatus Diapherotrites archaeon]|nr:50S ribosomal protein L23 [Candidatus Diapherotrites archaeon]
MVKLTDAEKKQMEAKTLAQEEEKASKQLKSNVESKAEKVLNAKGEKKIATPAEKALKATATLHDMEVVLYPLVTEKAVNMIEAENKITFIVNDNTNKQEIKKVLEEAYGIKIEKVNIIRDMKGRKKAIVRINKKFKAGELATKLGVL